MLNVIFLESAVSSYNINNLTTTILNGIEIVFPRQFNRQNSIENILLNTLKTHNKVFSKLFNHTDTNNTSEQFFPQGNTDMSRSFEISTMLFLFN